MRVMMNSEDEEKKQISRLLTFRTLQTDFFFFFFNLVTGPRRSLSRKLSDTRVYEPQIRARLGTADGLAGHSARKTFDDPLFCSYIPRAWSSVWVRRGRRARNLTLHVPHTADGLAGHSARAPARARPPLPRPRWRSGTPLRQIGRGRARERGTGRESQRSAAATSSAPA